MQGACGRFLGCKRPFLGAEQRQSGAHVAPWAPRLGCTWRSGGQLGGCSTGQYGACCVVEYSKPHWLVLRACLAWRFQHHSVLQGSKSEGMAGRERR